jgi:predicted transcriptional regulator of viral defense system
MAVTHRQFRKQMAELPCFSLHDIRKHFPAFDRKRLTEWQQKGLVQQVIRGYYVWDDFDDNMENWWAVAGKIYAPSYVSLQSALQWYQAIPEGVFSITSVSTLKTAQFSTASLHFSFRHIKPTVFLGYAVHHAPNGMPYCMASPEKALLDMLYLNRHLTDTADFESLRLNRQVLLEKLQMDTMATLGSAMGARRFTARLHRFKQWLHA